tara:strand:+ start:21821 stop:22621 length:801 start_codon:yes stop_codon:yes gene_type:complete
MSIKLSPKLEAIPKLDDMEFGARMGGWFKSKALVWDELADIAVVAILHYYDKSLDSSRVKKLYQGLHEHQEKQELEAFVALVRKTTGIVNIKPDGKFNTDQKARDRVADTWQSDLEAIADGKALKALTAKPKDNSDEKDKPARLKTPKGMEEKVVNSAQILMDTLGELPPGEALALLDKIRNGEALGESEFDAIHDLGLRDKAREVVKEIAEQEKVGGAVEGFKLVSHVLKMSAKHIENVLKPRAEKASKAAEESAEESAEEAVAA